MKFSPKREFNFSDIHVQEVLCEISKLNLSLWGQMHDIPAKPKDVVAPFLTLIFNASLRNGIFCDVLKIARVSPIPKSGNKKKTK